MSKQSTSPKEAQSFKYRSKPQDHPNQMKILVAEDDPNTLAGLVQILQTEGYTAIPAANGREAIDHFNSEQPDIACLDVMMPLVNGYDVCKQIRKSNQQIPILFISAKSEEIDKVLGLELGADDFIVKPFGVKEVVARIRAVTRRCLLQKSEQSSPAPESFQMNDLTVFPSELRAYRNQLMIDLSFRDMKILELLHQHQGEALHRDRIFDECWDVDYFPQSRSLDQHISQLRKRIEKDPRNPEIIKTVHGVGYRFE
jgi:DNA-binding response OmpR family regulator